MADNSDEDWFFISDPKLQATLLKESNILVRRHKLYGYVMIGMRPDPGSRNLLSAMITNLPSPDALVHTLFHFGFEYGLKHNVDVEASIQEAREYHKANTPKFRN